MGILQPSIFLKETLSFLQVIIVMDPAAAGKPRLPIIRRSSDIKLPPREKRYVFDKAYDGNTDNRTLYNGTVKASYSGLLTWSNLQSVNACIDRQCDRHLHW